MATKLYPIGMQTFSEIREEDFLYIDKTEYIYRMSHTSGKYFFLARPRRFGKSLLVSTMQSYFEGKKELFKGLAVDKLEKEWTEYPVLHFDMSGGKHMEPEQLKLYLGYILKDQEKKWGINEPRIGANNRLIDLINTAYEKSGKQVVVLIDEYDAPMLDVAHEKEQYNRHNMEQLQATFEVGGKKKKQNQLQNIENGYVVKDDIETGYGNIIPLWMFGMLY